MHILITGGTGFIGRALIKSLLTQDHKITVLSRDSEKVSGLF
ncbi:MAG: NAD-dependent epimerase/dehydratase family protein, partial [Gammaproteobacteria bacterium]|nr:NAD-dependent epimerase/dehydratase family protein [Gammaproteobacteria bacterium]